MAIALSELARFIQGEPPVGENPTIRRLAPLAAARPGDLSFLPDPIFQCELAHTAASAVLLSRADAVGCDRAVVVKDVLVATARASSWLPEPLDIERDYGVDPSAELHPTVALGAGARVGAATRIGAHVSLGPGAVVGAFCQIDSGVAINQRVTLGNRVRVGANSSIGADPFMFVQDGANWLRFPDFGGVSVGDDVDVGASVTIDRGLIENTEIESGVKLDNQVHIGHGARLGRNTVIAARATVAGEVVIGEDCRIGGASVINEGVYLASGVVLAGMSGVTRSIISGGSYASVWPAQHSSTWWRQVARLKKMSA